MAFNELCASPRAKARKSLQYVSKVRIVHKTGSFQDWPRGLGLGLNINAEQTLNHVEARYQTGKDTRQIGRSVVGGGEDP
jgi:hypothetical protein